METLPYYATDYYLVDHGEMRCYDLTENYIVQQEEINTRIFILGCSKNELWAIANVLGLRFGRRMKKHELIKCLFHVIRELKNCPPKQQIHMEEIYC